MNSSSKFYELLRDLLPQLPSLIVMVVCMIVAVVRWRRHPRPSLIVLLSLTWFILHGLVSSIIYTWVPDWIVRTAGSRDVQQLTQNVYLTLGLIMNTSLAIALALMLVAVFTQRPRTITTQ